MNNIDREEIRIIVEQVLARMGLLSNPGPASAIPAAPVSAAAAAPAAAPPPCPAVAIREGRVSGIPAKLPAEVSARHVHLTTEALAALFGPGASLGQVRPLSQPGEFLSDKRVRLSGPKGSIENVAVLGPLRKAVQAELSVTDTRVLGIAAPLRVSGDLSGAVEITIAGPAGTLKAPGAAIIAANHLHLRPVDAEKYGVKHGDFVKVRVNTVRPLVFEKVAVRVSDHYMPALHLDFDEANACILGPQDFAEILSGGAGGARPEASPALPGPAVGRASQPGKPALITESDARRLVMAPQLNGRDIHLPKGSILTPSAKDVFLHAHCTLVFE